MLFTLPFVFLSVIHLTGEALPLSDLKKRVRFATKPLLMPLLALFYFSQATELNPLIFAALFVGWLGDVFLLFSDNKSSLFHFGLFSFLMGHIFYIATFSLASENKVLPLHPFALGLIIFFILFGVTVFLRLKPYVEALILPIFLYTIAIALMGISTALCLTSQPPTAALISVTGAVIFMISDTINGWHRFVRPVPKERLIVMSTYLAGQFLLILGYIKFV